MQNMIKYDNLWGQGICESMRKQEYRGVSESPRRGSRKTRGVREDVHGSVREYSGVERAYEEICMSMEGYQRV